MSIIVDRVLDCTGLTGPLPMLRTRRALDGLAGGQVLKVIATNPAMLNDVRAWSRSSGNMLLDQGREGIYFVFYIEKAVCAADDLVLAHS